MTIKAPKVSLCMIVQNEESNLAACLDSVRGLVDEIVIVDTGSTDRTKEIAAAYGAFISDFHWIDDFSIARNKSLELAKGKWVFWLDADHRLDRENYGKLKNLFESIGQERVAYEMRELSHEPEIFPHFVHYVRLFPNDPKLKWRFRVHEQIVPSLGEQQYRVQQIDLTITHVGYDNKAANRAKLERNLRLLQLEKNESATPETLRHAFYFLSSTHLGLGNSKDALEEVLEGLRLTPDQDSPYYKMLLLNKIKAYEELNEWEKALDAGKSARRKWPSDSRFLFHLCLIYENLGDLQKEEATLIQLLVSRTLFFLPDPQLYMASIRDRLAHIELKKGYPAEAEKKWLSIVHEYPHFAPAWLALKSLWIAQNRLSEIESAIKKLEFELHDTPLAEKMRDKLC